jgi:hypothetical protein
MQLHYKNKLFKLAIFSMSLVGLCSCEKFIDVVPDNVPTIDNAFTIRTEAEKYLYTCYSYLPKEGHYANNPGFGAGDEIWQEPSFSTIDPAPMKIAMGFQTAGAPLMSYWDHLYKGIRDCNIFLENVDKVVDLEPYMKTRWVGEVIFLKAYFHWYLLQMYGPIPVVDKNLPSDVTAEQVKVQRVPVDSVVNYVAALLDSAAKILPPAIQARTTELGRVTAPVALAVKARLLVTAASPLFNGNADYTNFKNLDGNALFNTAYDAAKWTRAAEACKAAIDACHAAGIKLYKFDDNLTSISDALRLEMSIRNSVCEKWNEEIIWGSSNSRMDKYMQRLACPKLDPSRMGNQDPLGQMAPTIKIVEQFYSQNGVPIEEDKDFNYANRFNLRTVTAAEGERMQQGYETAVLNFDREPRFYANISFDGARWFMQNGMWNIQARWGQPQSRKNVFGYSVTGYFTKKTVNWKFVIEEGQSTTAEDYPFPLFRLADLYLLYAEALNESAGATNPEIFTYLNRVRERAGLQSVQTSWSQHSKNPSKYATQDGLRSIIQQERLIEMSFEANRFWDLRRWKRSIDELNKVIQGWDIAQASPAAYYRPKALFTQTFQVRDYLWPIRSYDILVNPKLVQNPGW